MTGAIGGRVLFSSVHRVVVGEWEISAIEWLSIQTLVGIEVTLQSIYTTVVLKHWLCYRTGAAGSLRIFFFNFGFYSGVEFGSSGHRPPFLLPPHFSWTSATGDRGCMISGFSRKFQCRHLSFRLPLGFADGILVVRRLKYTLMPWTSTSQRLRPRLLCTIRAFLRAIRVRNPTLGCF